jgi:hypothetical protein
VRRQGYGTGTSLRATIDRRSSGAAEDESRELTAVIRPGALSLLVVNGTLDDFQLLPVS